MSHRTKLQNSCIDLLAALQAEAVPSEVPRGFYTLSELVTKSGIPYRTLSRKLKALQAECRWFKVRTGLVTRPVPHYRIKS